jgi:AsmA-like protein
MAGRRWLRVSLIVVAFLLLLALGTLALLPRLVDTPAFHASLSQTAGHVVGRPVKFASISVSLLPLPNVKLRGLEIADDPRFGATPVLQVGEVRLGVRVRPLLSLRIELASIALDKARVELVEEGGRWNVATLATAAAPPKSSLRTVPGLPATAAVGSVLVSRVRFTDAAVHVRRRGSPREDFRVDGINAIVSGVGGAELDIRGEARLEPGGLKLSDIRATVGFRGPEPPVKASLGVEAADVAPLAQVFLVASPSLSGPVKGRLQLAGTPARLGATGEFELSRVTVSQEKPQCPAPTRRRLVFDSVRVPVLLKPAAFESAPLSARLGRGTLAVNATVALDAARLVRLTDIKVAGVELLPVLEGYLCEGFAVSGVLDLGGELSMRASDMWRTMNGTGHFAVGPGRVVGKGALALVRETLQAGGVIDGALRGNFSGPGKTALEFQSITGTYRITGGLARTDDLAYRAKDLTVTAAGTYALADGRTDMAVVITQSAGQFRAQVTGSEGSYRVVPMGVKIKDPEEIKKFLDRLLR